MIAFYTPYFEKKKVTHIYSDYGLKQTVSALCDILRRIYYNQE